MPKKTYYYGNRREFLKTSSVALGALAAMSAPYFSRGQGANDRIRVASIGVGGKGDGDSSQAFAVGGDIVAICDVDSNNLTARDKRFKESAQKENRTYDAKMYSDW